MVDHINETLVSLARRENLQNIKIFSINTTAKGECYSSNIYRVAITGQRGNTDVALNFFVKKALTDPLTRDTMGLHYLYSTEVYFYAEFLPMLDKLQTEANLSADERFSYAKMLDYSIVDGKEYLVLEDLIAKGYLTFDRHVAYDRNHLMLTVQNLARYHAATLALKQHRPENYANVVANATDMSSHSHNFKAMLDNSKARALRACRDKPYRDRFAKFLETAHEELMKCWDPETASPYNLICHGDCWSNNILFKYKDRKPAETILIDWQLAKECSPVTDIATVIFLNGDKKSRANFYGVVLTSYYETLKHNATKMRVDLNKFYPEEVYWDQVEKFMKFGLVLAVYAISFVLADKKQSVDLASFVEVSTDETSIPTNKILMERLEAIIDDSESYGFF